MNWTWWYIPVSQNLKGKIMIEISEVQDLLWSQNKLDQVWDAKGPIRKQKQNIKGYQTNKKKEQTKSLCILISTYFILCVWVSVWVPHICRSLWKREECVGSTGTGATDVYELLVTGPGSSRRAVDFLHRWDSITPAAGVNYGINASVTAARGSDHRYKPPRGG